MTSLMLSKQTSTGEYERWYGDGNVTRTALMYAMYKTQGLRMQPWEPDLKYGAVYKDNTLYIAIHSKEKWAGKLFFDYPRNRDIFHLPLNYARINEFPEWFTVEPFVFYNVTDSKNNKSTTFAGIEMKHGIKMELKAGESRYIKVEQKQK